MRKPVYAICKQQRHKSACTSLQSDQRLCCSLPGWYNTVATCYIDEISRPAAEQAGMSLNWSQTPEDRFSRDVAHLLLLSCVLHCVQFADDIICAYKVALSSLKKLSILTPHPVSFSGALTKAVILPYTQFYAHEVLKNPIQCLRRAQIFSYVIVP